MIGKMENIARYRYLILIIAVILTIGGYVQIRERSMDLLPEFALPIVQVQTEALGLSAEEVESLITVPMEADLLNGISWMKTIRSESLPGLSSIVMVFENGTDIWKARQLVQERLTQAHALPNVSRPPVMLQPVSSMSRVMQVGLSSEELSNIEISVEAHWNIRPRLLGVPGVANVSVWGQRNRQLQVRVDPARLNAANVSLKQVLSTTGNALWFSPLSYLDASTPGSGGFIDTPNQRLTVRHLLPISTPDDFAKVAIEGTSLTLGDITTVVEDRQPLIGDALVGDGPGVLLVIEKFPWADTLSVTRGIEAALADLTPSLPGITIDTSVFRRANFIEEAAQNIWVSASIGAALLVVVLALMQHNWRSVVVAAIAVPVSLSVSVAALYLTGIKPDIVMLAGLLAAVGVVVTDAIAGASAIMRGQNNSLSVPSLVGRVLGQSRGSLIFASLAAIVATLPLLAMANVAGAVAMSLALPFGLAVVVSVIVSSTLTPALWVVLQSFPRLGKPEINVSEGVGYLGVIRKRSWLVMGLTGIMALTALGFVGTSERSLIPSFNERAILIDWTAMPGTSRTEMVRVASRLLTDLRALPAVASAGALVGRAITSDRTGNVNTAQIWMKLRPGADRNETLTSLDDVINLYPGSAREVLNYSEKKLREFRKPRAIESLTVRVFGYELDQLEELATQVRSNLSGIDGAGEVSIVDMVMEPVLKIEADLERSKAFGIKPGDIRRTAAILLSGLEVGSLFEDQKVFEVVLWGVPEVRNNVTAVSDILIDAPGGGLVRLGDVADVSVGALPNVIRHDAVSRYRDILIDVSQANIGAVASEVQTRLAEMRFPLEYHAELLPDYVEAQALQNRILLASLAAAAGILLLIQAAVGSWRLAAVTFVAVLAGVSGGAIVMMLTGNVLSAAAVGGLLGTFAVAIRGALAMINRFQGMERAGAVFGFDLVDAATREQAGSILTTGIATAAALLPLAIMGQIPGLEVLSPLSMVMIGGLFTATMVNLYAVPMLYLLFGAQTAHLESELIEEEGKYDVP